MTFILEEDGDDTIFADAWSDAVACPRERIRLELAAKIAEFQKNDGKITVVPTGLMTGTTEFCARLVTNNGGKFTPAEVKAYVQRKTDGLHYKIRNGDAEAVEMMKTLLDTAQNTTALAKQLQCSTSRVQRLVDEYFPADARADKFRHSDRDMKKHVNELELVAKIRKCLADGMVGTWPICKACHSSFAAVTTANKKYKLGIPRGKTGRQPKEKEAV